MKLEILDSIRDLRCIEFNPMRDERGHFSRLYCEREFFSHGIDEKFVQINHSYTRDRGTVRGIHFQHPPSSETKGVRVLKGRVFDVVVDLRRNSPTFLNWCSIELTDDLGKMLIIPKGCAHGFQTLTDDTHMIYFQSEFFNTEADAGYRYNDTKLAIDWPLHVSSISPRDSELPFLPQNFQGIEV